VALAFAREGADFLVSFVEEDEDAAETDRLVEAAGRQAVQVTGDLADPDHCRRVIDEAVSKFGRREPRAARLSKPPRSSAPPRRCCINKTKAYHSRAWITALPQAQPPPLLYAPLSATHER
jgi:NAD(P)-dependent dehydrogenase (short-subunit alcohol dehydrogenase family)